MRSNFRTMICLLPMHAVLGVLACCALGTRAMAQTTAASASAAREPGLEQLGDELRSAISALADAGAFGAVRLEDLHLDLRIPAHRMNDLGLVVDSAYPAQDGVLVLGVTPGLQAGKMGVRAGDRIVAINTVSLSGGDQAVARLREVVAGLPDRAAIALTVSRGGQPLELKGAVSSRRLPAMRLQVGEATTTADATARPAAGCGRISDFDVAPRQRQLHAARVLTIDGQLAGPSDSHVFRVGAGSHTLEVGERIDPKYLPFNDRQRQAGERGHAGKKLEVVVAPNTTLMIAARLIPAKLGDWRGGAYWEPVMWKSSEEACP